MKRIERITTHTRGLLPLLIALLLGGVALCHAQAPEKVFRGIRYTKTGDGTCRASMVNDYPHQTYTINSPVTIDGEECRVTSISDMGINAVYDMNEDNWNALGLQYYSAKYAIKFPEYVDTICAHCFHGHDVELDWGFTLWKDFSFPKSRVIESYAFATLKKSAIQEMVDISIPEGVEEIGCKINGEFNDYEGISFGPQIVSLPYTLRRMSALGVTGNEIIIWAKTPPEIIPTSDGCMLPINYDVSRDKKKYESEYLTIYVPEESIEAYKKAPGWCNVPNIKAAKPYSEDMNGIRYTVTGDGICDAQALADVSLNAKTIKIPSSVTLQGQVCKVTSISNMSVNKQSLTFASGTYPPENSYTEPMGWTVGSNYPVMICNYSFPPTVEVIGKRCFYRAEWPNLQLPANVKEICDEAFYEFGLGLSYWVKDESEFYGGYKRLDYGKLVVPEGVESIGFNINYKTELASLPSTLKIMTSRAIWFSDDKDVVRDETNSSITCYAKEPPMVVSTLDNPHCMVVNFDSGIGDFSDNKRSRVTTYPEWFTLYVPEESVEAYKNTVVWRSIPNILPIRANALENVVTDREVRFEVSDGAITVANASHPIEVYTTDGRRVTVGTDGTVSGLNAGLYIVRCGATVNKVYVR